MVPFALLLLIVAKALVPLARKFGPVGNMPGMPVRLIAAAMGCLGLGLLVASAVSYISNVPPSGFTIRVITLVIGGIAFLVFAQAVRWDYQQEQLRNDAHKTNFPETFGPSKPEAKTDDLKKGGWI